MSAFFSKKKQVCYESIQVLQVLSGGSAEADKLLYETIGR